MRSLSSRVLLAVGALALVTLLAGIGYYVLGRGTWDFSEALYMAVNAASTSGFREAHGMDGVPGARALTILVIVAGLGAVAYFQSNLTAMFVEGAIGHVFRIKRMRKQIEALNGHVVVAGCGATGEHVIEELSATGTPFVAIDTDEGQLQRVSRQHAGGKMLFVVGDATEDAVLVEAGIARAGGVVATLHEDKDNLYVTLSARTLNPAARIVSKVVGADAVEKMLRAGASATVSPNTIGGRRMASEIVRPTVVEFLDQMLRERDRVLRFEEFVIVKGSDFEGKTLREVPLRRELNLLVVALRVDGRFLYNPDPDVTLRAGTRLVVLGETANVARLRGLLGTPPPSLATA